MKDKIEPEPEELEGKTLIITHMNRDSFEEETAAELRKFQEGEEVPSKKVFEDPGELAKIFTEKRQELINEVKQNPPESISKLAKKLGRGKSEVHGDLEILQEHGIVFMKEEGQAKKPRVPYDEIRVEFNLLEKEKKEDGIQPA
jgi:predicted transcriptional regulator